MVCLYIWYIERPLFEFTPTLVEVYKILKERGEKFEIAFVPLAKYIGNGEVKYRQHFESILGMHCPSTIEDAINWLAT